MSETCKLIQGFVKMDSETIAGVDVHLCVERVTVRLCSS